MKQRPYLIGIAGPSGAGKSYLAERLVRSLPDASIIPIDAYYPDLSHLALEARDRLNFDDPEMLDSSLLLGHMAALTRGEAVEQPLYDFARHTRLRQTRTVVPGEFVIVEGIFTLHWPDLRDLLQTKVFVEIEEAVGFERRVARDVSERGRSWESVNRQFHENVVPMCERYVRPSARFADVQVHGAVEIEHAVATVLAHVNRRR